MCFCICAKAASTAETYQVNLNLLIDKAVRHWYSKYSGAPAHALNERAIRHPLFPRHPKFHRALADDVLLGPLKHAAQALGYALR